MIPGASRDGISGWLGDVLKIRVSAPPEKGRANEAVKKLLANMLGAAVKDLRIVHGSNSARKTVEIDGMSDSDVLDRLPARES